MSYNNLTLLGRSGREISLRYTPAGKAVCDISIAVDSGWGDNKQTVWVKCTCWGGTAEAAGNYVKKGDNVMVSGELKPVNVYQKKDGTTGVSIEMTVNKLTLIGNSGGGQSSNSSESGNNFEIDDNFIDF